MSKTVISVKVDTNVKNEAQALAKSLGLNLSSLVNTYLRQVVSTRRVELYAPEVMTPELEKALDLVETDIKAGHVSKAYSDINEMFADLKK